VVEKKILSQGLAHLRHGGLTVNFWDGTKETFGPDKPYVTITIKSPRVVRAMMRNASLAIGEGYMNGDVEVDGPLDNVIRISIENHDLFGSWAKRLQHLRRHKNTKNHQAAYIQHHYDLGNDFYKLWLDNETMAYTCAYFRTPKDTLEQAQVQKMDHVLRKLQLEPGQSVAELGCGWGHLLVRAAKLYGVHGVGVTLSKEQASYAKALAKREKVEDKVRFELMNYQDLPDNVDGQFDRVMSVGMLEHVGLGNQHQFFKVIDTLLKEKGVAVIHSITAQTEHDPPDAWIDKYIFPGGYIPSVREVTAKFPTYNFYMLDYENLRYHYKLTLDEWWRRYEKHKRKVIAMYGEQFYRMWRFWLACSSGSFNFGSLILSQWVLCKGVNNDLPLTREHIYAPTIIKQRANHSS
jgi:cyclopropane-fatty-acyl-phospholipid synthase